jgi:hypothetical protein
VNASGSSFPETDRRKRLKLCGNCDRVSFGLNREEVRLLDETLRWGYTIRTVQKWLAKKNMKMPGGFPDLDKKRVVEIVLSHRGFCPAAKILVYLIDQCCFLWLPRPEGH